MLFFLDWDGVIQVGKGRDNIYQRLLLLNRIIENSHARVVLISNRRSDKGIGLIIKSFQEMGIAYNRDIIPFPSIHTDVKNRASLIELWLSQNNNSVKNFVILDDSDSQLSNTFPDRYLQL